MKRYLMLFVCIPLLVACENATEVSSGGATDSAGTAETLDTAAENATNEAGSHMAESTEAAKPAMSAGEMFESLTTDFDNQMSEFRAAYEKAPAAERRKLVQEKLPRPDSFSKQFMEIVDNHPDDPAAVKALAWIASNVRGAKSAEAIECLFEKYVDSEEMGAVCGPLMSSRDSKATEQLQMLVDKSPHDNVKGMAMFGLASRLKQASERDDSIEQEDYVAMFKKVVSDYSDLEMRGAKIGELAGNALFEIENLSIGSEAPDIEGNDLDGAAFKLSDYRGKVVLLDFWGDW